MMKQYDNYLFDLYGTLADIHTNEESISFWRSISRLLGMQGVDIAPTQLKEKYAREIARLDAEARAALPEGAIPEIDLAIVFRGFFEDTDVTADDRTVADFARTFRLLSLKKLKLFPGVLGMLETLHRRGKQVYLLSNAQALFTRPELTLLGLDTRLDGVFLSSKIGRKKPDPAFFQSILDHYGLDPAKTCMVGNDDICDCHGAAAAGLDSFYVCTEQSPKLVSPLPENCIQLDKIADLANII